MLSVRADSQAAPVLGLSPLGVYTSAAAASSLHNICIVMSIFWNVFVKIWETPSSHKVGITDPRLSICERKKKKKKNTDFRK